MITLILWTLISVIGLFFSGYETYKSWQSVKATRNKHNGRKIVARYLLFKASMLTIIFLDFAFLGGITSIFTLSGAPEATLELLRTMITRPAVVIAVAMFVSLSVAQTTTRVKLEREYYRQNHLGIPPNVEDK